MTSPIRSAYTSSSTITTTLKLSQFHLEFKSPGNIESEENWPYNKKCVRPDIISRDEI